MPSDLLRDCAEAVAEGADFPTVWQSKIKGHRLVVGTPEQIVERDRPKLRIHLVTGQRLIFDSASKSFSID